MAVLVIAEHDNVSLKASTAPTLTAAAKLGGEIHVLVAGQDAQGAADAAAKFAGVARVLLADDAAYAHGLAENLAALIVKVGANGYSHVVAPASFFGKNVLPRAAALLDAQAISDVTEIVGADIFVRPVYAGNAFVTVQSLDKIQVLSIRPTSFDAATAGGNAPVEKIDGAGDLGLVKFVGRELTKMERPALDQAKIVVSGGRGLGSGENFKTYLEPLADKLGAAIGASRAAVDAGYVPNDYQVGQTGKIVVPQLYMAIGISGAIQHLAGMKDSKVIVAINKDPDAAIFSVSDYGLTGDLFQILPELTRKI